MKVSTKDLVLDILSEESEDKKDSKPEKSYEFDLKFATFTGFVENSNSLIKSTKILNFERCKRMQVL